MSESPVLAIVAGRTLTELPPDLFIPPDALEVLLDSFTGPLDLLLYLIRKQNIDIMDIPMSLITEQYRQYIELLEHRRMELAADYLVMAAVLIEIKSRLLLPVRPSEHEGIEEDPRMELVRRLQNYEQFQNAALQLDQLPRLERDVFQICLISNVILSEKIHPNVSLTTLVDVMKQMIQRHQNLVQLQISRERLSVRERMLIILNRFEQERLIEFNRLLHAHEGRLGVVVTFLAILELSKQALVHVTQTEAYAPILLRMLNPRETNG